MVPSIKVLSDNEILEIDRTSRDLLQVVGIRVDHEEALDILDKAGASVDNKNNVVKIPDYLIENTLKKCQATVYIYGRNGIGKVNIGGPQTYFATCGTTNFILDMETGKYREALSQDLIDMIKLADVLTPPDLITSLIAPVDIPTDQQNLYQFKLQLMNTGKPLLISCKNKNNLEKIIAMSDATGINIQEIKERPFFSVIICITSPLIICKDVSEMIIELSRLEIPICIDTGPMAGATSPATLASTLVTGNAEHLASIVLAKSVNPSVPIEYCSFARIFDMKSATVSQGGPENGILRIAASQMARFYKVPSAGGGIMSDSKLIDVQMGLEKTGTALLTTLGGINMVLGMGLIASLSAASLEALLVDHEVVNYAKRVLQGIKVNEETINLSVFEKAGIGGEFLTSEHTLDHFKTEMWISTLFNRDNLDIGTNFEKEGLRQRIKQTIVSILEKHTPQKLPKDVEAKMDTIIQS